MCCESQHVYYCIVEYAQLHNCCILSQFWKHFKIKVRICVCACMRAYVFAFDSGLEGGQGITSTMLGDLVINRCLATTHHLSCPLAPLSPLFLCLSHPQLSPCSHCTALLLFPSQFLPCSHPFTPCHIILHILSLTIPFLTLISSPRNRCTCC